jgi:hypothetical protein
MSKGAARALAVSLLSAISAPAVAQGRSKSSAAKEVDIALQPTGSAPRHSMKIARLRERGARKEATS